MVTFEQEITVLAESCPHRISLTDVNNKHAFKNLR